MRYDQIPGAIGVMLLGTALAVSCKMAHAEQGDWTLHTITMHIAAEGLNNVNPGAGYDVTDHLRVGALVNSYEKPAAYVAGFLPINHRLRVGAGVISGYDIQHGHNYEIRGKTNSVVPLVAVEYDFTDRLSVVWFFQAISLEVKFR